MNTVMEDAESKQSCKMAMRSKKKVLNSTTRKARAMKMVV